MRILLAPSNWLLLCMGSPASLLRNSTEGLAMIHAYTLCAPISTGTTAFQALLYSCMLHCAHKASATCIGCPFGKLLAIALMIALKQAETVFMVRMLRCELQRKLCNE